MPVIEVVKRGCSRCSDAVFRPAKCLQRPRLTPPLNYPLLNSLPRSHVLMAKFVSSMFAVAMLSVSGLAFGQDAMLEELYGRGVHAFFSGNQSAAFDSLNKAINSGSRDPRAFYYRGLLLNRFGR